MHIGYWGKARRKETTRKTETSVGGQYRDRFWRDRMVGVDWIDMAQDRDQ
jgi:hypothetical protein